MKLERIGNFLLRSKIPVDIEDDKEYNRVTIRINHNGVSLRDKEIGKKIGTKKQFTLKAGQFILSKIDARYGAFGIAPDEVDGAIITGNFWAYDVDKRKINIEWLNQFTNSSDFYELCERASSGITHRKYLDEDFFLNYEILLPNVDEQLIQIEKIKEQKISFGELSTELTHQHDLLKQLRQAFLREATQGKLVKQEAKDGNAKALLQKIKAEKEKLIAEKKLKKEKPLPPIKEEEIPFNIPENWAWCRLGEIGNCQTGTTPSTAIKEYFGKDIPFIKPADITLKGLITNNEGLSFSGLKEGVLIPTNSLMMVCIGGSIGKSYFTEFDVSCNQQINTIAPLAGITAQFLQYFLQSDYFQKAIWAKASGGTTPIVNRSKWESIFIPLPPLAEQKRIVKKLEELMNLCDELQTTITNNRTYTNQLLQVALKEALQMKEVEAGQ